MSNKLCQAIHIWVFLMASLMMIGQEDTLSTQFADFEEELGVVDEENDVVPAQEEVRKFDENYKRRYESAEFDYEIKPKSKNAFQRFLDWLFGSGAKKSGSSNAGLYLVWFLRIFAFLVIIYVVFAIVSILLGKKGNWLFDKKDEKRVITFPLQAEDIISGDFKTLYEKAMQNEDYKMAVRYRYLLLLQQLAKKNIISYHKDKTNSDYYYEIKDKNISSSFSYVSYIYEHIWYGGFELQKKDLSVAVQAFDHTSSLIRI
ncbi:MAG: hypothetical protein IPK35_08450 [Saprospiraceae bacterium]|jgi:hypothetical protein|nr:hypothetical protein [Saprospiraceae bacterium]